MRHTLRKISRTLAAFTALGLIAARPGGAQTYNVYDLGALPGGNTSMAYDINAIGQVTGHSLMVGGVERSFLWTPFVPNGTNGVKTQQFPLPGHLNSYPSAINSLGRTAGISASAGPPQWTATLWNGAIPIHVAPPGSSNSYAADLNNFGTVVGFADVPAGRRGFVWTPTVPNGSVGLWTDLGDPLGGDESGADAINNFGTVVGYATLPGGVSRAVRWSGAIATDLGTLGGQSSSAYGINTLGKIVGYADVPGGNMRAFLWNGGVMMNLNTLPGYTFSAAYGINGPGKVVGKVYNPDTSSRAFLWDSVHGIRDLNTLIPPGSGWVLRSAQAINDDGQIVGWGMHNGQMRAFLLKTGVWKGQFVDIGKWVAIDREPYVIVCDPLQVCQEIQITNTSATPLVGPLQVVIHRLEQGRVMTGADGTYHDNPFVTVPNRSLAPGASRQVRLFFNRTATTKAPNYYTQVYAGSF